MATFLLLPAHFLGGAYWERVITRLTLAGHRARALDLAGWGSKAELIGPDVGLAHHVREVSALILEDDLHDVILVAHSYSGMVAAGVAGTAAAQRLGHLVFLDAPVPRHGQTLFDHMPEPVATWYRGQARTAGDGWRVPPPSLEPHHLSEADRGWLASLASDVPLRTCEEPLDAAGDPAWDLPHTYMWCRESMLFADTAMRLQSSSDWRYRELAAGHFPMVTHPEHVGALLLEVPAALVERHAE